ncbi:tetratricopeptide repeat protein [Caballeronia calidae]|uniref:tetratricopeptide repeat protein n=1 Tax=Caballeronia calidae TaxID=1777139 RepID=UPI000788906C|nr:tetratricopeptide repeat protein [Caballeronia calidae]
MIDTLSALLDCARIQFDAGQLSEARVSYEKALALAPENLEALRSMGLLLMKLGRHAKALEYFQAALKVQPQDATSYVSIARIAGDAGQPEVAIKHYRRALEIEPANIEAASSLSHLLTPQSPQLSAQVVLSALTHHPDAVQLHYDMGQVSSQLRQFDDAVRHYRRAYALAPQSPEAANNLGLALETLGHTDEALQLYRELLRAHPTYHNALLNLSMLLLLRGEFAEGWTAYESRFSPHLTQQYFYLPRFPFPLWSGQPLAGKRLLVLGEQGLGDQIQFLRFAEQLAQQGAIVDVTVELPFVRLAQTAPGVHEAATSFTLNGQYDYWVMMMSIPQYLKIHAEAQYQQHAPYLHLPSHHVCRQRQRIQAHAQGKLRVGLVWAGNPSHARDWNRSIKLEKFKPLSDCPDVALFSLQKGAGLADVSTLAWADKLCELGTHCDDLTDTATALMELDLLITVDTSVAHLAGALGVSTWVLVGACPDWRWGTTGKTTAWYSSLRLKRQRTLGQWDDVLEELALEIRQDSDALRKSHRTPNELAIIGLDREAAQTVDE